MTTLYKLAKEQLSKQYHYDFGLRALKSVLVMAGSLKREFSSMPEDQVLMRSLRVSTTGNAQSSNCCRVYVLGLTRHGPRAFVPPGAGLQHAEVRV